MRSFKKGDEKSLIRNINNKKIARYTLHIPYPYKLKDARSWINLNLKLDKKKQKPKINFAIDIDGNVIGGIGLDKMEGHKAEIGYWLGEKYWRKGIMTEAVKLVAEFGFKKLGLKRICAFVFLPNKISARVLKGAGYKYEGRQRKNVMKNGKFFDDLVFAKVI